jgi:hypothetical protein
MDDDGHGRKSCGGGMIPIQSSLMVSIESMLHSFITSFTNNVHTYLHNTWLGEERVPEFPLFLFSHFYEKFLLPIRLYQDGI